MAVIGLFILISSLMGDHGIGEALLVSAIAIVIIGLIVAAIGWILAYVRSIAVRSNPVLKTYISSLGTA